MSFSKRKLILVELNEISFDLVEKYVEAAPEDFKNIGRLLRLPSITTSSEADYQRIEPWIQWVSVHTGLTYLEHQVYRLGDIVESPAAQLFEKLEDAGLSVGAVSPMNAENRTKHPKYFVPDPWTLTQSDGSFVSRSLTAAIRQAVNDNADGRLTIATAAQLGAVFAGYVRLSEYGYFIKTALQSLSRPWRRALFLDSFLSAVHLFLFHRRKPNFSTIFLNAGAHIQHHYLFNSRYVKTEAMSNPEWYVPRTADPFVEMLRAYDRIMQQYLDSGVSFIVATGLSQVPYDRTKYYYRLKSHKSFLVMLGIDFLSVHPRMTRDFLIVFESQDKASKAADTLAKATVSDGRPLFGDFDLRANELFITLTYPCEITADTCFDMLGISRPLIEYVTFVAIKNAKHCGEGRAFFSEQVAPYMPKDQAHVSRLSNTILEFFGAI